MGDITVIPLVDAGLATPRTCSTWTTVVEVAYVADTHVHADFLTGARSW